ncbi:MAG: hypothetical protein M0Z28_32755 [Rhodospirillales bacterium]|nr:hypothetical protein [Rhodospirillales bacterium]
MSIENNKADYKAVIGKLSVAMRPLGTGDLAELRRMAPDGPGCAAFWRLAAACGFIEEANRTDAWMRIVKIMAILTPKGERTGAPAVHDPKQRLGASLCDGGDPAWGAEARPLLSETRLMRFLAESDRRAETLERIARMLAARRKSESGFDCAAIAALLLFPASTSTPRDIARAYYRRLDHAAHEAKQKEDA